MVGVEPAQRFTKRSVAVSSGDWLVLVTGGITHARDAEGRIFGARGVARHMLAAAGARVHDPAGRILDAARAHTRDGVINDASVFCIGFA